MSAATHVDVFPTFGQWQWEPRDGRGRPAWVQRLEWNRHSGLHATREAAEKSAGLAYPGLPIRGPKPPAASKRRRRSRR